MKGGKPYDVIILGAGLSGLLAAALLARRGRYVLVLEETSTPGGFSPQAIRGRFSYLQGPVLFLGFERDGLYDRLFLELGLSLSLLKQEGSLFRKSIPPFQVILPNHRLNFYDDPGDLFEELSREFPDHHQGLRSLLMEVDRRDEILRPWYYLIQKRTIHGLRERISQVRDSIKQKAAIWILRRQKARSFLNSFGLDQELYRGMELLLLLFTGRTLTEATGLDLLLLLGLLRREIVTINGGAPRLSELLVKVIHKYEGDVVYARDIKELVIQRKRLVVIRTEREDIPVNGECILNLSALRLPRAEKARHFLTLYFGIECDVLPSAMGNHLLMSRWMERPPFSDNFLFLVMSGPTEDGVVPEGQRALQVITCLEEPREPTQEELTNLRNSVETQLTDLMPFSGHALSFLGHDLWSSHAERRFSAIDPRILARPRGKGYDGAAYYTFPIRNLFLLPDEGQHPVAHMWQARAALELAERILQRGLRG